MEPKLDWSDYENEGQGDAYADIPKTGGNFAKAVAVCINSMVCLRPVNKSVMCPSFRVRQDAAFSPGGRSRLLKRSLNGEITEEEKRLLDESMSACIGCKGCKRECETGLDISAIRAEYLAKSLSDRPFLTRDILFANLPKLLEYPKLLRFLFKTRNKSGFISRIIEKGLGISTKVQLPLPSASQITKDLLLTAPEITDKTIVLLADSFTKGFSPQVIAAAYDILDKAGYDVRLIGQKTAIIEGRTWFSAGLIEASKDKASQLLSQLQPYVEQSIPVLGLEPSSTLMIRDEYKLLGLGKESQKLSDNTFLFEEFLAREISTGRFNLRFTPTQDHLLIHGHCHQKAVGAMKSVRKILKLIPDLNFEFIDSSCCGGGGSFAYEVEHQPDSEKMFNLTLKEVLENNENAVIIANGFSCKSQIKQYSNRNTMHLAEFLQRLI